MSGEVLIGGIASANLVKGMIRGYAIYVTTHRIIGIKKRKGALAGALMAGMFGAVGAVAGSYLANKLTKEESDKAIHELADKSDLMVWKDHIMWMELKKPGLLSGGHLKIGTIGGKEIKIKVLGKKEFNALKDLLSRFKPEVLRVKE